MEHAPQSSDGSTLERASGTFRRLLVGVGKTLRPQRDEVVPATQVLQRYREATPPAVPLIPDRSVPVPRIVSAPVVMWTDQAPTAIPIPQPYPMPIPAILAEMERGGEASGRLAIHGCQDLGLVDEGVEVRMHFRRLGQTEMRSVRAIMHRGRVVRMMAD